MAQITLASSPSEPVPDQPAPDQPTAAPKAALKKRLRILLPLVVLMAGAGLAVRYWVPRPDTDALQLSGRIEGYDTNLGAKVGGRIAEVTVREGDTVQQGQVIARLDDREVQAQLTAAQAQVAAARQQVSQAQLQINVIDSQIQEAQLTLQQAQGDSLGRVDQSTAAVAVAVAQLRSAQAQVRQAESALALARVDRDRLATLVGAGAISQQQFDQAQTQLEAAQATLAAQQAAVGAAQQQVTAAQGTLTQAQTSQLNPDIRTAQVARLQTQREQAQAQLTAAQADLEQAQARQTEAAARLDNLAIVSPIDGVVATRSVEPGQVIAAGTPILTVINLDDVFMRGYIPQGELGLVRVGQSARVFLDSAPDQPLAARVAAIDTEASFTPENIYFREDRVTQVFGLKLSIANPAGFAKPGMPADGEIVLDPSRPQP